MLTKYFQFRLPLTPWFTDFVVGQPVVELLCNNLKTLINRFKTVICIYSGVEVTASNPTEGSTSCTAVINRESCLRNFSLRYWWLHDVRSSNCGKITDSFFCLCLLMLFPCTWWLTIKDSLDKCDTSFGVIFQMGDNSVNLICLYKSLEMMMINIHFTVNRLFLLDTCLCWNKWKITVV